ncbi:MAG: hypothetical protein ABIN89_09745 [Chitinophagaceae bacterium]
MKKRTFKQDLFILLCCFVISRVIVKLLGVSFDFNALYEYWQYLDVTSLSNNLLQSLWYQHSQPPVFNLLLGIVLKCSGNYVQPVMESLLIIITFCNGLFLLCILRAILYKRNLSLIFSLLYVLSPATILFENELFYTTFLSFLLLMSVFYIVKFNNRQSWQNVMGIFVSLSLVCLTKSMYHIIWLVAISGILLFARCRKNGFNKILIGAFFSIMAVGGWYLKNYWIFGSFSASSWTGMNLSRVVFQNIEIKDTTTIASVHPFLPIANYKNYISDEYKIKYIGINDRILLDETKNDHFINMNNAGFLDVSTKYMDACVRQVQAHPVSYLKNVSTAFIIFFTPASSYFKVKDNNHRMRYYDMIYSFNPSHIFDDKQQMKQSLALAAVPKFLIYCFVFFIVVRNSLRATYFPVFNIFIIATILFTLVVSSLFEYGENMRFRYEIEPLFLIVAAQAVASIKRYANNEVEGTEGIG